MTELEEIKNALAFLLEHKLRDERSGIYLGRSVSEMIKRIFAGEQIL